MPALRAGRNSEGRRRLGDSSRERDKPRASGAGPRANDPLCWWLSLWISSDGGGSNRGTWVAASLPTGTSGNLGWPTAGPGALNRVQCGWSQGLRSSDKYRVGWDRPSGRCRPSGPGATERVGAGWATARAKQKKPRANGAGARANEKGPAQSWRGLVEVSPLVGSTVWF